MPWSSKVLAVCAMVKNVPVEHASGHFPRRSELPVFEVDEVHWSTLWRICRSVHVRRTKKNYSFSVGSRMHEAVWVARVDHGVRMSSRVYVEIILTPIDVRHRTKTPRITAKKKPPPPPSRFRNSCTLELYPAVPFVEGRTSFICMWIPLTTHASAMMHGQHHL